jgi:hypothetical protein
VARIDREELRGLVRQALKDALGAGGTAAPVGDLAAALGKGKPGHIAVAICTGADLDRFAREILKAGEPVKSAILAGDLSFDLATDGKTEAMQSADKPSVKGGSYEVNSGVLSEAKIVALAKTHRKILVGSDVVMTPLARDKAREMKVELVRQKP